MMYKSPLSTSRDEASLRSYVSKISEELRSATRLGPYRHKQYSQLFHINVNEKNEILSFEIKENHYSEILKLCGCFALFCTRNDLSPQEVLDIYRAKDCVEKTFNVFKKDILNERLEVKNQENIYGKLFIVFIGLLFDPCLIIG